MLSFLSPSLHPLLLTSFASSLLYTGIAHYLSPHHIVPWIALLLLHGASFIATLTPNRMVNLHRLNFIQPYIALPALLPLVLKLPADFISYLLYGLIYLFHAIFCHALLVKHLHETSLASKEKYILLASGLIAGLTFGIALHFIPTPSLLLALGLALISALRFISPLEEALTPYVPEFLQKISERKDSKSTLLLAAILFVSLTTLRLVHGYILHGRLTLLILIAYCLFAVIGCFISRNHPVRFGVSMLAVILSGLVPVASAPIGAGHFFSISLGSDTVALLAALCLFFTIKSPVIESLSSAYGNVKVVLRRQDNRMLLVLDQIIQGSQFHAPEKRALPLSYYSNNSPIGQIFSSLPEKDLYQNVAIIGLGVGTLATYGTPKQTFTFYEINPAIIQLAQNSTYFTYLKDSKAKIEVTEGDARKTLLQAKDHHYGLIIEDAFIEQRTPKHMLTREAFRLYFSKLQPGGMILLNVTSKDEQQAIHHIAALAKEMGLAGFIQTFVPEILKTSAPSEEPAALPKVKGLVVTTRTSKKQWYGQDMAKKLDRFYQWLSNIGVVPDTLPTENMSTWVAIGQDVKDMLHLPYDSRWKPLVADYVTPILTDSACNYDVFSDIKEE